MKEAPFGLNQTDLPSGWSLRSYETLGSTNDEALGLVREGHVKGPTAVITRHQTAGRGRGRAAGSWSSLEGNLTLSLVHFPTAPIRHWSALSYAAGLTLAHVLGNVAGFSSQDVKLKWPNDVFVAGGKVGGILLETVAAPDRRQALVLGMGLNIETAPELDRADYVARSLRDLGFNGTGHSIVVSLLETWATQVERFDAETGSRDRLFRDWQSKALYLNETISVRIEDGQRVQGTFLGLDPESGALRLQKPGGEILTLLAGELDLAASWA